MMELKGKYNNTKIFTDNINENDISQIINLLNQKIFEGCLVRFMPDCHSSNASMVGTVMTIDDKVCPSLLGGDLGCGVLVTKLKEKRIELPKFDSVVTKNIPSGASIHKNALNKSYEFDKNDLYRIDRIGLKDSTIYNSLGTLGGGNHFISLEKNENGEIYLIIHTGSRNTGKIVNDYYKELAYQQCKENDNQPYVFSYLEGNLKDDYLHDVNIIQKYAALNRKLIKEIILKEMKLHEIESFDVPHNYISDNILRKGAIRACKSDKLIIPLNMKDGSLIGYGKGNDEWLQSGPHGAGRKMSRSDAKNTLSVNEFKNQMKGIYSSSVGRNTIDEAPGAYKDKDEIIENISDTIEITEYLTPIYNFKSGKED